jgi:hypothetical protein
MISNRPEMARERWLASVGKLSPLLQKVDTAFSFVLDAPFTATDALPYTALGATQIVRSGKGMFNWWPNRTKTIQAVKADYYLMTDDDCRFGDKTPSGFSSWQRYLDAIKYMEKNPDCGVVCMSSFFGGTPFGRKIITKDNILFASACGLLLRNIPELDYSHNAFNQAGALEDVAAVFSRIERGYYAAKTFNTPTAKPPSKRIEPGAPNRGYDDNYVYVDGLGKIIRDRYNDPKWHNDERRIPAGCLESYHIQCRLRGTNPVYKEER